VNFHYFPQEDFYGIGPGSNRQDVSDYLYQCLSIEGVGGVQFTKWLGWSLRGGLLAVNIQPGTDERKPDVQALFTPGSTPGLSNSPDFLHIETGLLADYRDKPGDAHKGGMIGLILGHFDDRGSDQFGFERISVETRQYVPLWSDYRTLAVRFLTSFDRPSSGSEVPFYLMESLGGSNSLRGFPEYRFRDRNLLLMSAEYRWDAAEFLEMALFYDTGKVFSRPGDFDFTGLEKGYGGGLRIKRSGTIFLRLELGHSREGNQVHFRLGPSF
jgi:outer membrane protein assembly factor BamA